MKRSLIAATLFVVVGSLLGAAWFWQSPSGSSSSPASASRTSDAEQEPAVRGRVVDGSNETILDATVTLEGDNRAMSSDGTFEFSDLEPETYRLDVQADGYVSPGPKVMRQIEVDVPPASKRDGPVTLTPTLREPVRMSGRVVAGGDPLPDTDLTLYYKYADGFIDPLDPFALESVATTDDQGRFEIEAAPGRLHVVAEVDAHPSKQSAEMYLEPGERRENVIIDVAPEGVLTGRITDEEGQSVRATIALESSNSDRTDRRTETDRRGNYRLGQLPAGPYKVVVRAPRHRTRVLDDLRVSDEQGETRRDVTLEPASGIFGRVVGPDGEGVSGTFVRMVRSDDTYNWLKTRTGGTFEWARAPEGDGTWTLRAFAPRFGASSEVTTTRGEGVTLKLEAGGYIEGEVVDGDGQPVSSYTLGVGAFEVSGTRPYGSRALETRTIRNAEGTCRYGPLRPGRYRLRVRADGYAAAESRAIEVESGDTSGPVTLTLGRGGTIRGVVRSQKSGQPISGASVEVHSMTSPFEPNLAQTDSKGRYELTDVPGGRRSLQATHDGHLTRIVSGLQVPEDGEVTRDIRLDRKQKGEDFSFQGIGAVLNKSDDGVVVRQLVEGGAAKESGLTRGDVIEAVDRESVQTWPLSKVIKSIRGREGEPVTLRVRRDNGQRVNMTIERGEVVVE